VSDINLCRAADVVRQHPNVMCVVDHCGLKYLRDDASKKLWSEGVWLASSNDWLKSGRTL